MSVKAVWQIEKDGIWGTYVKIKVAPAYEGGTISDQVQTFLLAEATRYYDAIVMGRPVVPVRGVIPGKGDPVKVQVWQWKDNHRISLADIQKQRLANEGNI